MIFATDVEKGVVSSAGFKGRFGTLAAHPYDKEKPDRTVWWLFPKSAVAWGNWPAYSAGKYYFSAGKQFFDRPEGPRVMRLGLHVEKGISEQNAQQGYGSGKGKYFGMTSKWAWHGLLDDLENGNLLVAMEEIAARAGVPVEVAVEPNFPLDEPVLHEKFGYHRFEVGPGGALRVVEERAQSDKLAGVGTVTSLGALAQRLRLATAQEQWTWINFYVSVGVPCFSDPPVGSGPAWTGTDFWHRVLEPLAGWVR
jgi:hypothetical protein